MNRRPVFTAKMISDMAKSTPDTKLVTLYSMATGSVGTVNYQGNLYEVRVTPVCDGVEKWSHPKTKRRTVANRLEVSV
ncbi:hypothetical protein BH10ACI2_BH10ACI2_00370 [soil metagenome]